MEANGLIFGTFGETHGLSGRDRAIWLPAGVSAEWSHGSASVGGVGIWFKDTFRQQFSSAKWLELEPGRVGMWRLDGPLGSLDVVCVYLDTGSYLARQNSIRIIARSLRHRSVALTVMCGDWNFVERDTDRWNLSGEEFSGDNNLNPINAELLKNSF